jgi:2-dehydro-3-deoxyphosphooctonate aldolase (KDO 8-P synthase)
MDAVAVGGVSIGPGQPFALIAGPCVLETEDLALRTAEALAAIAAEHGVPFIFKSSFDKANRTSGTAFRGPGLEEGLRILGRVRREIGVPVTTDVHEPGQCAAAEVDLLQIPAFLCRQTDLLLAAAATGRPVNLKKGQFVAPADLRHGVEKLRAGGAAGVVVTDRGTGFGYGDLVLDLRAIPTMAAFAPVVVDVTHSCQRPGGGKTGGDRSFAPMFGRAALAAGADALFAEVHPDPDRALSDAATQLPLAGFAAVLRGWVRAAQSAEKP